MIIDAVQVRRRDLKRADPQWRTASYAAAELTGVYVGIKAGGVLGVGASAAHPRRISAEALTTQIADQVPSALMGKPIEAARHALAALPQRLHPRAAIAVDLALADLVGRLAGVSAEVLWGGPVRDRILLVRMVGIKEPEAIVSTVRPMYESGVRAFKVKVGDGVERDVDRARRLRDTFDDATLMVDANGAYGRPDAADLCRQLGGLNVHCVEQPLPYDDIEGMADLRKKSPVPLMADQMVESATDAVRVGRVEAADLVSLKLTKMGSVAECVRVASVCAAMGLRVHVGGSAQPGIVDSALTRLAMTLPEVDSYAEVGESAALIDDEVCGVTYAGAYAASDGGPGLGGLPSIFQTSTNSVGRRTRMT